MGPEKPEKTTAITFTPTVKHYFYVRCADFKVLLRRRITWTKNHFLIVINCYIRRECFSVLVAQYINLLTCALKITNLLTLSTVSSVRGFTFNPTASSGFAKA